MTPKQSATLSKDEITSLFHQLVEEHQGQTSRVVTKEEQAARAKERQIVDDASKYTVESIVKGVADLQLTFGTKVDELLARLLEENAKLEELRQAIEIETRHAKLVSDVKIAADALHVQTLENKEELRQREEEQNAKRQTLNQEIENTKAKWEKERKQLEISRKESEEQEKKNRAKGEADFIYDLERKHKVETDAFNEKKRKIERDISETTQTKEKAWTEREKALAEKKAEFEANQARIATLPQELEDAVKKAREESIKDAHSDARVKARLLEKEVEANRKVYELQIKSLEEQATKLQAQIDSLTTQLQTANREVQELAIRAVEGSTRQAKAANAS
ncbi:MAG: hypothetical protein MUF64_04115 [Polyangiaceae bacterium]|jgi:hypothetical protein|nr:hypothetical protein [Polyangiaceae bacterium]